MSGLGFPAPLVESNGSVVPTWLRCWTLIYPVLNFLTLILTLPAALFQAPQILFKTDVISFAMPGKIAGW